MGESVPIAIFTADWHLSSHPPLSRQGEPDWFAAMNRAIGQVCDIKGQFDNIPIFFAGDLFDKPRPLPKLVNFAIDHVPYMAGIPGQHDLPWHGMDRIDESGFGTLERTGRMTLIQGLNRVSQKVKGAQLHVWGYPWGHELTPCPGLSLEGFKIAIVHQYVWKEGFGYPTADEKDLVSNQKDRYKGWDLVVYGDNHIPFEATVGKTQIFNCGSLMRRNVDQILYEPSVGVLLSDGTMERWYLDTSGEVMEGREMEELPARNAQIDKLLDDLQKIEVEALDFITSVKMAALKEIRQGVKQILQEAVDGILEGGVD